MENVVFIPFPKPKTQREKCERWVKLCGRQHFTVNSITKDTYMCSKHFVGEKGPTKENPDPLPALATSFEKRVLSSKRKRKSPMKRYSVQTNPKRKKLKFETESSFETTCTQPSATSNISTEPDLFYTTLSEHSYSSKEDTQPEENQDDGTLQDSTCPEEEDVEQIYHCETVCPGLGKLKRTGYLSTFRYFYRCMQLTSGTGWRHLIELEI